MRSGKYIDFNTGVVKIAPMDLRSRMREPLTDDQKLDLFECRVEVWTIGVAVELLRQIEKSEPPSIWSHAAYGMLTISMTYFEMIGKILNPYSAKSATASHDFNMGFCDVYPKFRPGNGEYKDKIPGSSGGAMQPNPDIQDVIQFRDRIRNGLFHVGYTKHGVWIHSDQGCDDFEKRTESDPTDPSKVKDVFRVNAHGVTRTLVEHFPKLVNRIKMETQLATKLAEYFDTFLAP